VTVYPFKLLLKKRPAIAKRTLADLLPRLRCEECDQSPASAAVTDHPNSGSSSTVAPARTWIVDVL